MAAARILKHPHFEMFFLFIYLFILNKSVLFPRMFFFFYILIEERQPPDKETIQSDFANP